MNEKQLGCVVLTVMVAGLLLYIGADSAGGEFTAPEKEEDTGVAYSGLNSYICPSDQGEQHTGHEWHTPSYDRGGEITLPHRYPRVCGANMTAVMHHGFSALNRPNAQDNDWVNFPPSEVAV
jgi:hypothetical protein